jgi:fumarate reductase flavoprotein subunit
MDEKSITGKDGRIQNIPTLGRRQFITGAAAAAGIAALTSLAGCNKPAVSGGDAESSAVVTEAAKDISATETVETDIVVVGGGISGLAASVQAAQLGARVILIEAAGSVGGNGYGTEGIFAVGSKMQEELGIDLTLADIISKEQDFFKYKVNALFWKDMVSASAENIEWLKENGVGFSGVVDDYVGIGRVKTMHWWKDGDAINYIEPMQAKAESLGVEIRLGTRGVQIIKDGQKVTGLYAQLDSGDYLQINANAVILATGGFADNIDKLRDAGIPADQVYLKSFGGHMGDGLDMAIQAGAKDLTVLSGYLRETSLEDAEYNKPLWIFWFTRGNYLWVNQEGERYADENSVAITSGCMSNASSNQDQPYGIISKALLDAGGEDVIKEYEQLLANGSDYLVLSDSLDEIADKFSIDAVALKASVDRYNSFCDNGVDEDFGKAAEALVRLDGPYIGVKFHYCYMSSLGGIKTSRNAEVLLADGSVIPGLYAVGSDGCQLYYGTYTISVCGSFNGNNVYSGRNAARCAWDYIGKA